MQNQFNLFLKKSPLVGILRGITPQIKTFVAGGSTAENLAEFWSVGTRGFGFGTNIYSAGDTPEIVASKARGLVAAAKGLI